MPPPLNTPWVPPTPQSSSDHLLPSALVLRNPLNTTPGRGRQLMLPLWSFVTPRSWSSTHQQMVASSRTFLQLSSSPWQSSFLKPFLTPTPVASFTGIFLTITSAPPRSWCYTTGKLVDSLTSRQLTQKVLSLEP